MLGQYHYSRINGIKKRVAFTFMPLFVKYFTPHFCFSGKKFFLKLIPYFLREMGKCIFN